MTASPTTGGVLGRLRVLSGAQLKYIAMISMLMDHANKALIYPNLNGGWLLTVSDVFDVLGRIAFPLFAFFLVEGFCRTSSRGRYLLNLLLFGLISEVPFDLCTTRTLLDPNWNNIMFTLALMLLTLWAVDALRSRLPKALWYPISWVIVAVMCLAAMLLAVDYEYHAILMAYFFYIFRSRPLLAIPFSFISMYKQPWALLGLGLTLTYNGQRGRQYKWLNYGFYPAHLLVLGLLRVWLNL